MSVGNIGDYSSILRNYSVPVIPAGDRLLSEMQLRTESMVPAEESPAVHETLDMEKAISDMQKDPVLRQYQYFVESAEDLFSEGTDGIVLKLLQPT